LSEVGYKAKRQATKTVKSNREIHLHANVVEVLRAHTPLHVDPEDYLFTTP
jgi:hypothetical protein